MLPMDHAAVPSSLTIAGRMLSTQANPEACYRFALLSFPLNRTVVYVWPHFLSSLICLVRYFPTPSTVPGKYQELSKIFLRSRTSRSNAANGVHEREQEVTGAGCG